MKQFQTGPYVNDYCDDKIRLRKGLYRIMMTGEAKFEGCGEDTLSIYPGIRYDCEFLEPKEVY
jgi:hypothetical protein